MNIGKLLLTFLVCLAARVTLAAPPDFQRDVFPILQRACLECHNANKQSGELRLDVRSSIPDHVLSQNNVTESELIRRITLPTGHAELMPARGQRLTVAQQKVLTEWIAAGATWPENFVVAKHWAYIAPVRPAIPQVSQVDWPRSPIDYFVLQKLDSVGLKPSARATPEKLIRRLYLDLIGLPPSIAEIEQFTQAPTDQRLSQIVDELLSRPQFGERWARPWLDAARFADSHGFQRDNLRDIWAYRDWVIAAFNSDMPFDQFTIEQLAGDLLPNATLSQRIATGFHRTTPVNVEAGSLPEETRIEQVIDRVNTTAAVWLGTTLECCQCHDHKYDPFAQREYYQLLAFFNNTEPEAERKDPKTPSSIDFKSVSIDLMNVERDTQRSQIAQQRRQYEQQLAARRDDLASTLSEWAADVARRLKTSSRAHVLKVLEFQSQGTTDTHKIQPDGSVLLQGDDPPDKDVYTVRTGMDLADVRGFRLDVLQHDSLPGRGPGRGDAVRRNFVLNKFEAEAASEPLNFKTARASFSQKNQKIEGAIDDSAKSGWAVSPQFDQAHWAIFALAEPIELKQDQPLTFRLTQSFGSARTIGCFRISAITGDIESDAVPQKLAKLLAEPASAWTDVQRQQLLEARVGEDKEAQRIAGKIAQLESQLKQIAPDTTEVMVEMKEPRMTQVFTRGDYRKPGEEVWPGTPAVLHASVSPMTKQSTRLDLARWLIDKQNPLVARVTVNRWWGELFGQPIVTTPEDFGVKGEPPTHPELLDWLACEYMDNGWSLKQLLKTIVLSSTYQQSSNVSSELRERDPNNALLARGASMRMDAEMIRDNALAISGLLSLKRNGPSIRPFQPEGIWKKVGGTAYAYEVSSPEDRYRRGIYVVLKRGTPYPSFINFDANPRVNCTLKRSRTNTPLQALTLLNDPVYVEAADALAERATRETTSSSIDDRLTTLFRLCTARKPTQRELDILREHFQSQLSPHDGNESRVWRSLAAVVMNLHETICKD